MATGNQYNYSSAARSFTYRPTTSGTYYVAAAAGAENHSSGDATQSNGGYSVRAAVSDDMPQNTTTSTGFTNGSLSGTLEIPDDQDWARITLVAGQRYTFNISNGPLNFAAYLYNSSGVSVASGSSGMMTYTAASTGAYYFGITGSSFTGSYLATVTG